MTCFFIFMKWTLFLTLTLFSSCAYFTGKLDKKDIELPDTYEEMSLADFIDHINSFKESYLNSKNVNQHFISYQDTKYLEGLISNLYKKNELFFSDKKQAKFYVIKDVRPFHFSLPDKSIFISSGLLQKYIKSEKLLYCLLTFELIRSEKNIYRKIQIVPTGSIDTNRMISILRLNTKTKVEVHKWSFYILKRIGIDTDNYLSWLQLQNRNSVDFSTQLGDLGSISREEALFKSFLIKNTSRKRTTKKYERSSKKFYNFINRIKS